MGASDDFVWEFNGPYLGPIGVTLGLPAVCYLLVALCNGEQCLSLSSPPTSLAWVRIKCSSHLSQDSKRAFAPALFAG
jgi:hypothetical protein